MHTKGYTGVYMLLQVLANTGEINLQGDISLGEDVLTTDTREFQKVRAGQRSETQY